MGGQQTVIMQTLVQFCVAIGRARAVSLLGSRVCFLFVIMLKGRPLCFIFLLLLFSGMCWWWVMFRSVLKGLNSSHISLFCCRKGLVLFFPRNVYWLRLVFRVGSEVLKTTWIALVFLSFVLHLFFSSGVLQACVDDRLHSGSNSSHVLQF